MGLLKALGLGKKKTKDSGYDDQADGLALAREQMLGRMRARMEPAAPLETIGPPAAEPYATPTIEGEPVSTVPPASDVGPVGDTNADPLAGMAAIGEEITAAQSGGDDGGLMDLFRDAKEEVEEGTLASEVEDVSIGDLLGDVVGISQRLGVVRKKVEPEVSPAVVEVRLEPEIEAEDQATGVEDEPPVVTPVIVRQVRIEDPEENSEGDVASSEQPVSLAGAIVDTVRAPAYREGGNGQRYLLHVLFLSLTVAMGAGLGIRGAYGDALVSNVQATPSVLAYLSPPVVPPEADAVEPEIEAFQKHVATTPTPVPTVSPTPSPTPATAGRTYPFLPGQPAYFFYKIQSGDSLSSIAEAFSICPDHILWNNPGRKEEDRLVVGDDMLLPGYPGVVYRLHDGETLANVAARYSTTVEMVLGYPGNHLKSIGDAKPGTVVILPDAIPPSALLQDADAQWAYTTPSDYGYVWPFYGPITTDYGEVRPGYVHYATDIGGLGHFGAPVLAVAEGTIDKVDNLYNGLGRYVVISHPDGSRSVYGHMSDIYVSPGDHVSQGEPVGALGCTGHSTGTHLHFELWRDGAPVNPVDYLP